MNGSTRILSITALLLAATTAYAHHSFAYHFDLSKTVTIEGVVKEFRFINPHAHLIVYVANENGNTEEWDCAMGAANGLARNGWTKDLFVPGQVITITGPEARRNPTGCSYSVGVLADGTRIEAGQPLAVEGSAAGANAVSPAAVADGIPNLHRVWQGTAGMGMGGPPGPDGPNPHAYLLSEAGHEALAEYDPVTDDPSLQCSPVSISRVWGTGSPVLIEQREDVVIIHHEWMDAERTVRLNQTEHPDGADTVLGRSIGWYEDSTLVIDTRGYAPGVLRQHPGLPHSDQLHTVERLTLSEDGNLLVVSWSAEDPLYFLESLEGGRTYQPSTVVPQPYNCTH